MLPSSDSEKEDGSKYLFLSDGLQVEGGGGLVCFLRKFPLGRAVLLVLDPEMLDLEEPGMLESSCDAEGLEARTL